MVIYLLEVEVGALRVRLLSRMVMLSRLMIRTDIGANILGTRHHR